MIFFKTELQHGTPDLLGDNAFATYRGLRKKTEFPLEKVVALKISDSQAFKLMQTVAFHIANKETEESQFETSSLTTNRDRDVDALNNELQIAALKPGPERIEPETKKPIFPKQQCLLYLSRSHDRKWDDLDKAWDALHDFIEPRLGRRASKIPSDERLEKWRSKQYYPFEQILVLNLSTTEVNRLLRSVCAQIANMEPEPERGPPETATPTKRPRDDVETAPASQAERKRAKPDPERASLPATTKLYFMEENNEDSRTGIMVTLLSNVTPVNGHIDIKTLRYGNATRHLAKRNNFEKHKHQIFYYDLENHNVKIIVDTVASFRAAVEEMFTYRKSASNTVLLTRKGGVAL